MSEIDSLVTSVNQRVQDLGPYIDQLCPKVPFSMLGDELADLIITARPDVKPEDKILLFIAVPPEPYHLVIHIPTETEFTLGRMFIRPEYPDLPETRPGGYNYIFATAFNNPIYGSNATPEQQFLIEKILADREYRYKLFQDALPIIEAYKITNPPSPREYNFSSFRFRK